MEKISADTIDPLQDSVLGNKYATILADKASGLLRTLPIKTKLAANEALRNAFSHYILKRTKSFADTTLTAPLSSKWEASASSSKLKVRR